VATAQGDTGAVVARLVLDVGGSQAAGGEAVLAVLHGLVGAGDHRAGQLQILAGIKSVMPVKLKKWLLLVDAGIRLTFRCTGSGGKYH